MADLTNLESKLGEVAGLGGIFKERVWYPRFNDAEPVLGSRRDALRRIRPGDRCRCP